MAKSSVAAMVAEIDGQIAELQRMRAFLLAHDETPAEKPARKPRKKRGMPEPEL